MKKVWSGPLSLVDEAITDTAVYASGYETVVKSQRTHALTRCSYFVRIPGMKVRLYDGMFYGRRANGEWEPDFAVTLIFNDAEEYDDNEELLYWEKDGFATSLANYFHELKYTAAEIENLFCELYDTSEL